MKTQKIQKNPKESNALSKWRRLYAEALAEVDQVILTMAQSEAALIPELVRHLIASGGKRLRPILTILSAKLCGYSSGKRQINLAAAVEFIHTATLLHDDVVDESDLRRGKETANHRWGNAASVLVGDFILSRAFQLMANDGSSDVIRLLADSSAIISEGEVKQLLAIRDLATTQEQYVAIIAAKTAQLFAAACAVGGLVAEKTRAEVNALENYGRNLGIAFQMVDDALDYSAKQETLGKTIGNDFREGKMTLPVLLAYARGDQAEKMFWQQTLTEDSLLPKAEDLARAIHLMETRAIIPAVLACARTYAEKAKADLADFVENDAKHALLDLADFAVERGY